MIDPKYQAFKDTLIERDLAKYIQPRHTISIPYMLKGKCGVYAVAFAGLFPELKVVTGFYNGAEHFWCQHEDGTIIDPTVEQFYMPEWSGDPTLYRIFDEEKDEILLGRCMNCGEEIYGLEARGEQSICSEQCQDSLTAYYNNELSRNRYG